MSDEIYIRKCVRNIDAAIRKGIIFLTKVAKLNHCIVIAFSGSSETNHDNFIVEYFLYWRPHLNNLFRVVQKQTTTAYCRILPTLDYQV